MFATLFKATIFVFAIASSHLIFLFIFSTRSWCLNGNDDGQITHATYFSLSSVSNYFFVAITIRALPFTPWFYLIPSLHIFTLPLCFDLIPCLYFILFLLYPPSLLYSMYLFYSPTYVFIPFVLEIFIFDWPLESTTNLPSLTILEWKVGHV